KWVSNYPLNDDEDVHIVLRKRIKNNRTILKWPPMIQKDRKDRKNRNVPYHLLPNFQVQHEKLMLPRFNLNNNHHQLIMIQQLLRSQKQPKNLPPNQQLLLLVQNRLRNRNQNLLNRALPSQSSNRNQSQ
ncbi:hypothetical protein BLA29_006477, partial [Euroglyphus maynei]